MSFQKYNVGIDVQAYMCSDPGSDTKAALYQFQFVIP